MIVFVCELHALASSRCWTRALQVSFGYTKMLYMILRDTCRFRVLTENNGTMDFNTYPKPYNHAHSLHVYFWHNLGTVYSNTYPELYKLAHSLLVYILHNMGTIHTIWVCHTWWLQSRLVWWLYKNVNVTNLSGLQTTDHRYFNRLWLNHRSRLHYASCRKYSIVHNRIILQWPQAINFVNHVRSIHKLCHSWLQCLSNNSLYVFVNRKWCPLWHSHHSSEFRTWHDFRSHLNNPTFIFHTSYVTSLTFYFSRLLFTTESFFNDDMQLIL